MSAKDLPRLHLNTSHFKKGFDFSVHTSTLDLERNTILFQKLDHIKFIVTKQKGSAVAQW